MDGSGTAKKITHAGSTTSGSPPTDISRPSSHSPLGPYVGGAGFLEHFRNELPAELDHRTHAMVAKATGGFSPISLIGSYLDWYAHLLFAPGKQMQIAWKAWDKARRFAAYAQSTATSGGIDTASGATKPDTDVSPPAKPCIEPLPGDRRFADEAWSQFPYNLIYQQFLLIQQWQHNVFTGVPGVRPEHEALVNFTARQALDVFSPSNFFWTNPEVLNRTIETNGQNLNRGALYFLDDALRLLSGRDAAGLEGFKVGDNLATTPGKIVFRNHLVELIQYAPTTAKAHATPVLIVPAWIMKYYVLDLSETNSLVKYLVDKGHTVFIASWRNPTEDDRDLGLEDYLDQGVLQTLGAVQSIAGDIPVNLVGYCLGGTLAATAAAYLARRNARAVKSLTMLAAQVDFEEAGELSVFISDSQLAFLDELMKDQGVLEKDQMSGAFQLLRSNDLIWSRAMKTYLMGKRRKPNDLMAWNADGTRMPARMHSEYLRAMYLNNDLAEGRFKVNGEAVSVSDINAPIFTVATTKDHVAPWRSVYKLHILADTGITFVLTSGGHNAGIVSEPGHRGRTFKVTHTPHGANYMAPDRWDQSTPAQDGSWWPSWDAWLAEQSEADTDARSPKLAEIDTNTLSAMEDAPGTYVMMR
ncbi:MAG: alpha/beta fold hydrolase [Pseudomonadota bacterium]